MQINLMREQHLQFNLEHSLPSLDQWCNCGRVPNTTKWQAILSMNFTKSFLPPVKKLPIVEYK
jgi:hypothetical protein